MAEATAASNPGMDRYNRYYNAVLAQLQQDAGPERSDSQIKNYLTNIIRPSYEQAIRQRQQQTGQNRAAIDTDAASRGMGTSTWVTDAKNRLQNQEAADIATLNSNYNATLYDSLLNQLQQRDQNRLSLMGQAQSIAGNMYDRWKAEDDAKAAAGSGGGGGGTGGSPGRGHGGGDGGDDDPTDPGYGTGNDKSLFDIVRDSVKGASDKTQATLAQQAQTRAAQVAAQQAQQAADKQKRAQQTAKNNLRSSSLAASASKLTPIYGASIKYDKYRQR